VPLSRGNFRNICAGWKAILRRVRKLDLAALQFEHVVVAALLMCNILDLIGKSKEAPSQASFLVGE
jgi:hypothetical protein